MFFQWARVDFGASYILLWLLLLCVKRKSCYLRFPFIYFQRYLLSLLTVNSFHAAAMFFHRICISQCFNVNASWYRLHSNTFKLMTSSVLCDSTECQSEIQDKCITYMYYECFSLTWGNSSLCCIFLWTSVHFLWQHACLYIYLT